MHRDKHHLLAQLKNTCHSAKALESRGRVGWRLEAPHAIRVKSQGGGLFDLEVPRESFVVFDLQSTAAQGGDLPRPKGRNGPKVDLGHA